MQFFVSVDTRARNHRLSGASKSNGVCRSPQGSSPSVSLHTTKQDPSWHRPLSCEGDHLSPASSTPWNNEVYPLFRREPVHSTWYGRQRDAEVIPLNKSSCASTCFVKEQTRHRLARLTAGGRTQAGNDLCLAKAIICLNTPTGSTRQRW